MNETDFIIRVYGIFIDPIRGLLVSDEIVKGENITKFPGGGLEYGEGTIDCLRREMLEEAKCEFEITGHFYTTDFFVASAYHTKKQVISIYYLMNPVGELKLRIAEKPFDYENAIDKTQSFRFTPVMEINPNDFALEIDHHVAVILSNNYK